jgi:N-acetylmuramoyl-L-alanine amidase
MAALCLLSIFVLPSVGGVQVKKHEARSEFEAAERMREELNGIPQRERTRHGYQRVMDAYRAVYFTSPASSKADASIVAVAELLAESGRAFNDEKALRTAITQYEFLRREYPGSKYRFDALFTIGQIYREDLNEPAKARETFQDVIHRYPHMQIAADAREAMAEMDQQAKAKPKQREPRPEARPIVQPEPKPTETASETPHNSLPLVTGIRHWSTPDYTRVAIDLEQEVKYEAGRVSNPDRIFFDLHDTKLASTLVGKSFEVSDGFLRRVRIAQFQKGMVRVVLEVDDVSDYAAFLLPNPYRLIIDIHGRNSASQTSLAHAGTPAPSAAPASATGSTAEAAPSSAVTTHAAETKSAADLQPKSASPQSATPQSTTRAGTPAKVAPAESPVPSPYVAPSGSSSAQARSAGPLMANGSFYSHGAATPAKSASAAPATSTVEAAPESTNAEVANLTGTETKATAEPTSKPTVQVVAPREPEKKFEDKKTTAAGKRNQHVPVGHQAKPTADGETSLIRALGLKVGRIVIDAGHGGHDTGTIGPNGLMEKDLVLDVSLRLGKLLQSKMGAEVIYTRDDDTFIPLETRTAIANQHQADLFISIHANSSPDPAARGVETYYLNFNPSPDALEVAARENAVSEKSVHELGDLVKKIALKEKVDESREFASDVQHSLYQGLAGKEKTMRDRGIKKAPFIVLIGANMPSILAEISFVSNPGDERKLQTPEYRQKIAESLYRGIARYIGGLSGVKVAGNSSPGEGQN